MKIMPVANYNTYETSTQTNTINKSHNINNLVLNAVPIKNLNNSKTMVSFGCIDPNTIANPILANGKKFSQLFDGQALKMFKKLGIGILDCEDGLMTITRYMSVNSIDGSVKPKDFAINENGLFKFIKKIKEGAEFKFSNLTSLGNVKWIGKNADFRGSQVADLGNLEYIGGCAYFGESKITQLGKLKDIGLDVNFRHSQITDLGDLEHIGLNARFGQSEIADLGKLRSIGGKADFRHSKVTNLGNLEYIGRRIFLCSPNAELLTQMREKGFIR